jgi:YD repeat-containing protein
MILTIELLNALGACQDAKDWCERNKLFGFDLDLLPTLNIDPYNYIIWLRSTTVGYVFNDRYQPIEYTNMFHKKSFWTYDERGNKLTFTNSEGTTHCWTYNEQNQVLTHDGGNGYSYERWYGDDSKMIFEENRTPDTINRTKWVYNQLGQLSSKHDTMYSNQLVEKSSTVHTYLYDKCGNEILMTQTHQLLDGDVLTNWVKYEYDEFNNCVKFHTSEQYTNNKTFNKFGGILTEEDNTGFWRRNTYNELGQLIEMVTSHGTIKQFYTNKVGRLCPTYRHVEDGVDEHLEYDDHDNCIHHIRPIQHEYWPNGQLKQCGNLSIPLINT